MCVKGEGGGDGVCGVKITFSLYNIIIIMISKLLPFSNRRASPFVFLFLPPQEIVLWRKADPKSARKSVKK